MNVMRRTNHPPFRLWTFGPWRIERLTATCAYETVPLTELGGTFSRFVLLSLLWAPNRTLRRGILLQRVAGPEDDDGSPLSSEQLASRLRDAVRYLNRVFCHPATARGCLVFEKDTQCFRLAGQEYIWVDADHCLDTLEHVQSLPLSDEAALPLLEAVAGYFEAGTFLEEEETGWVMGKRATLETLRPTALRLLIDIYERQQRFLTAEHVLRRIIENDPTDEEAFCRMAVILMKQGKHAEAIKLAELLQQRLEKEEISFTTATHHLLNQINKHWSQRKISLLDTLEAPHFAPSLAHVVQLPQTQNAAFGEGMPDESSVVVPSQHGLLLPPFPRFYVVPTTDDDPTSFGEQLAALITLIHHWQNYQSCKQLQGLLEREFSKMGQRQWKGIQEGSYLTRREVLPVIAALPAALIAAPKQTHRPGIVPEEFLPQCAASLSACWSLLAGNGLAIVSTELPKYLPSLLNLAQQPLKYQQTAAYLAGQGCLLMGLVALHQFPPPKNLQGRAAWCQKAVELANISGDRTLIIAALTHLGNACFDIGKLEPMLQYHQKAADYAEKYQKEIPQLLLSKTYKGLAHAQAQQAQIQEALYSLGQARETLPDQNDDTPPFIDYGLFSLILFEGIIHSDLATHDPAKGYQENAEKALAAIETVPQAEIPQRFLVEITIEQARAAVEAGNREQFEKYLLKGIEGAKALDSAKRKQEATMVYRKARTLWANDTQVLRLADLLI